MTPIKKLYGIARLDITYVLVGQEFLCLRYKNILMALQN